MKKSIAIPLVIVPPTPDVAITPMTATTTRIIPMYSAEVWPRSGAATEPKDVSYISHAQGGGGVAKGPGSHLAVAENLVACRKPCPMTMPASARTPMRRPRRRDRCPRAGMRTPTTISCRRRSRSRSTPTPKVDKCAQQAGCKGAGTVNALERSNTLLILDSSGSMAASAGGGTSKLNAAKGALRRYVAGTPDSLALGFMVYGHKGLKQRRGKARSCAGVELLDPIGKAASKRFDRTLNRFTPTGYTPLGAALRKARDAFAGKDQDINRIILVTDGVETWAPTPCRRPASSSRRASRSRPTSSASTSPSQTRRGDCARSRKHQAVPTATRAPPAHCRTS